MRMFENDAGLEPRTPVSRRWYIALLASKGMARYLILVLMATLAGYAHAERHTTLWRNSSTTAYTVTRISHNDCITDAGPSKFTVAPGALYGAQLTMNAGCTASIQWQVEQKRRSGTLVANVGYSEVTDHDGLWGLVLVVLKNFPGKAQHYFQAQCGTQDSPAVSCLGRQVIFKPPTKTARVAFNALRTPAEEVLQGLYWQPIRK